jgi:tetratricopeptide (TPR) repeat protein
MSRGRFAEAEERFKSYRFVVPEQANPHDSLGELFVALGRFDEAEASFEKAIEIHPDFWPAYEHIAVMKTFNGDLEGAREIVDRARAGGIPESWAANLDCLHQYMELSNNGAWQEIYDIAESSDCVAKAEPNWAKVTTHLAACRLGRWETALEIEAAADELLEEVKGKAAPKNFAMLRAAIAHMKGVRHALQGDFGLAEEEFRAADNSLTYIEAGAAIFKLYNRTILAELLLADGQDAEAHTLLSKVRGVNPTWVASFEESGLKILGLERG